jgi:hypothetical protein
LELTQTHLAAMRLQLDDKEVLHADKGFPFLGCTIIGSTAWRSLDGVPYDKKVLHWPAPFNLRAYLLKKRWESG